MFTVAHESHGYGLHRIRGGAWAVVYNRSTRGHDDADLAAVDRGLHLALEQGADTVGFVMNQFANLGQCQVQWITITQCLLSTKDFSAQQYWNHVRLQRHFWSGTVLYLDSAAAQRWADLANQMIFWYRLRKPHRASITAALT
jgi:hypothetical protein